MASFYKIMSDFTLAGQIVDLFNNADQHHQRPPWQQIFWLEERRFRLHDGV
jgi:hypothetical protein